MRAVVDRQRQFGVRQCWEGPALPPNRGTDRHIRQRKRNVAEDQTPDSESREIVSTFTVLGATFPIGQSSVCYRQKLRNRNI